MKYLFLILLLVSCAAPNPIKTLFSSVGSIFKAPQPERPILERRAYKCYEIDYWDAPYIPNRPKQRCELVRVAP